MSDSGEEQTNIRVAVRFRPLNARERAANSEICFRIDEGNVYLDNPSHPKEVSVSLCARALPSLAH
jgi:hypothetical protein